MPDQNWSALASVSLAIDIARDTALRLRDPQKVANAITLAAQQTDYPSSATWGATSVAQGNAGLAVLCAYLDTCFPNEGWDREGHAHLRLIAQSLSEQPLGAAGIFAGLSGVAFATWLLSRDETRYQSMLASLDEQIIRRIFSSSAQMLEQRHGFSSGQYDVITGLAGSGAYLLCRRSHPSVAEALTAALNTLIFLSKDEESLPHWYTPPERIMQDHWRGEYPDGLLDCGLAHGIAGPLALLSLARLESIEATGLDGAIERMADWLAEHRVDDDWGVNWTGAYPAGPLEAARLPLLPSRTAWCYGTPGIARALWLAGQALDCQAYRTLAVTAMEAIYRKPVSERYIDAPTFCHGIAGLLQVTLRFAHDTGLPLFHEAVQPLTRQLVDLYEPESLLGYCDIEPSGKRIDQAGLLTGAPGIVLALLAAATNHEPIWDRLFLLS